MSNINQIYKRTEVIGRGKFGIVYKGIHRATKEVYAIKVLNLDTSEDEVKDVQLEIQFLSHLKQVPNVTHYYGSYLNGTKLWIIMDYCAGGSLRTLLRPGRLEERYVGVIAREVLIALQFIHKQNVIHRDIKAANVLIANEGSVQLCDFGVAAQLTGTNVRRNTIAGTPYWMAPEVIMEGASYDVKADIWSLGITIYEIATGNPPYSDKEALRAMQLITKSAPPRLEGKQYSPLLKEIIALCLDENPTERLSAEELLKTKFVKYYKNSSTVILKELISRYLLWREKKSSRESIMMNVEDDAEENEIEVKWDFDSLSSNEYILENDINISNINLNENDHNVQDYDEYDDGDDVFMTGYQGSKVYGGIGTTKNNTSNITYNKNTVTYNTNAASTLKDSGTRKEVPKSLMQLFETTEEDGYEEKHEDSSYQLPKINSSAALHSMHHSTSTTTRGSTPIKEIEIPNFEEIETLNFQQHTENKTRSRANTLSKAQSATVMETARKPLDPMLQKSSTFNSSTFNSSVDTSIGQPLLTAPSLQQASSAPLIQHYANPATALSQNLLRATPSPSKDIRSVASPSSSTNLTSSPSKNSTSMKALQSSSIQSPLLQPINGSISTSTPNIDSTAAVGSSLNPIKRNYQNLRLQIPTPTPITSRFPKLLNTHSGIMAEENSSEEPVNQFGVNVSNVSTAPMTMTPLTEKPPSQPLSTQSVNKSMTNISNTSISTSSTPNATATSSLQTHLKRRFTNSVSQPPPVMMPFLTNNQRTTSTISSHSSLDGSNSVESRIHVPVLDISLLMDDGFNRERLSSEISSLLGNFAILLDSIEDKLATLTEN